MKNELAIFVLIFLLFFQLIYSFLFPACDFDANWLSPTTYLPKFTVESTDNFLLEKIYPLISPEYRLNSDVGNYLELAQNFNSQYFEGHVFLGRPLYSSLISLVSLPFRFSSTPSYGIIFGLAILLNFILIILAVLLFFSLLKKLFSLRIAFLSSILLIFSPHVHAFLIQPLAEMLMVFAVISSVYLLYNYIKKPSVLRLVASSLIVGVFMLGKMFFAIPIFILVLAICFRRYREGIAFLIIHLIPLGLWYLWVTQVWHFPYYLNEVQNWQMGVWLFDIFSWPWQKTYYVLLNTVPTFITALIFAFLLIPVIFSVIGFTSLSHKSKNIFYFGPILAVFLLGFLISFYYIRHVFLLFPIIYPTAALGMERIGSYLKRYGTWYSSVFYAIVIGLIIIISNINIYQVFDYLK